MSALKEIRTGVEYGIRHRRDYSEAPHYVEAHADERAQFITTPLATKAYWRARALNPAAAHRMRTTARRSALPEVAGTLIAGVALLAFVWTVLAA